MKKYLSLILFAFLLVSCTNHQTPLEISNFENLTSYDELFSYVDELSSNTKLMFLDTLAISVEGKAIPFLKVSSNEFGKDTNKVKVLIFAQQHGNEHSGKEALIAITKRIYESKMTYLLNEIDLLLIPQMNPDGSDKDKRRNGNDADLNRDHLILSQPETIGLHKLFAKYYPEVTLDIHEYRPFSKAWEKYGYQKNWDEQFGVLTNINISKDILKSQKNEFIPYIKKYLEEREFSFNEYVVGGPPNENRMRYSTTDINDGRQSFGILNTYSFILEGLNGRTALDNLQHRTEAQIRGILGFLEFVYKNKSEIKTKVKLARNSLLNDSSIVAIRMEHVKGEFPKYLSLLDLNIKKDTTFLVENFDGKVISNLDVEKPKGYLIPKNVDIIKSWLENHKIIFEENYNFESIYQYEVKDFIESTDEELDNIFPKVEKYKITKVTKDEFYFIPINQIHSNMLVISLEPQSQYGLFQYEEFRNILLDGNKYKILRIE